MSSYCAGCGDWIESGGMLCEKCGGLKADNKRLKADNAALRTRLDVATKALEWYADEKHYDDLSNSWDYMEYEVVNEGGERARQALKGSD